jgi:DNA-binding transcriptional regulator LsrR (DeoR family)
LSTKAEQLEWRRSKVTELRVRGLSYAEIARELQVSRTSIASDVQYLREQAKGTIKEYVTEHLPEQYQVCLVAQIQQPRKIAINPDRFDLLTIALRTAVDNDGTLDKKATSYNDIFDAFRLAKFYRFQRVGVVAITGDNTNSTTLFEYNSYKSM